MASLPVESRRIRRARHAHAAALLAAAAVTSAAPPARAQDALYRLALRLEGGFGTMLSGEQRAQLGYGLAMQGSARVGLTVAEPVAVQLSFANWWFPAMRSGQAVLLGGGVRLEPWLGTVGRLAIDANTGAAVTGPDVRWALDAGAGFEFAITRWFGIGPVVRYGRVFATTGDTPSDAQFWSLGLSVALRGPAPAPSRPVEVVPIGSSPRARGSSGATGAAPGSQPGDTDRDGVLDAEDLCPDQPDGAHPDRARRGCPLRDTDRDGVYDDVDQCPAAPVGGNPYPARPGCPDGDGDHDGVADSDDQCRDRAPGLHPDPQRAGCPLPDADGDGVPDALDACRDQPGAPASDPRRRGCPGLVVLEGDQLRILRPVSFAENSDRILPRSFALMRAIADALAASPEVRRVSIEGHTDSVGDDARNLALSDRRAASVMRWLGAHGVDAARLESHGFGETRPVQSDRTRSGRAANRRVEFRIVDPPLRRAPDPPVAR